MPLPSQSLRGPNTHGRVTLPGGRRTPIGPAAAAVGIVVVIAAGVWAVTRGIGGEMAPNKASAAPELSKLPAPPDKVLASNEAASKEPPPVEIRQGRAAADPKASESAATQPPIKPVDRPAQSPTVIGTNPAAAVPSQPAPGPSLSTLGLARSKKDEGDLLSARGLYNRALTDGTLSAAEQQIVRDELTKINDSLVFSKHIARDDPFVGTYSVQGGDSLIKISQKLALGPDYRLIARVNGMKDAHRLTENQKLKVVRGPFHAVVRKAAYRLDLYMGPADKQVEWVFVRSFRVGLGADNGTPLGEFIVKKGSKLIDPPWTNPRTGEHFPGADPKNPIGHRWIGIEGVGESAQYTGYGLHGTIEPESIGRQMSMGCVRMASEDIELMFELMGETVSTVKIVP